LGNDGGTFSAALAAVRRCGGVLEHPANTYAWPRHGLPSPHGLGWQATLCGGWVCEVWQSAYGHRANKRTWLYYVGERLPEEMDWSRPVGTHQVGCPDARGKARNKPTLGKTEASATPRRFATALVDLARNAMAFDFRRGVA
jgi:hypothetical protein